MTDDAERLLQDDRSQYHAPLRGLLLDGGMETMIPHRDEDDDHTLGADLGHPHAEALEETGIEESVLDAVIEIDP